MWNMWGWLPLWGLNLRPQVAFTLSFFTNLICKVGILGEDFIWLSTSDRHSYVSYHKSCGDHFITIFANVFSWPHLLKLAYFTNGSLSFNLNLWSRHPLCLRTYSSVHKWQILLFVSFRKNLNCGDKFIGLFRDVLLEDRYFILSLDCQTGH